MWVRAKMIEFYRCILSIKAKKQYRQIRLSQYRPIIMYRETVGLYW